MMTATQCPTADQLRAFSLGQLPEEESDELFRHLQECPNCKADLETVEDGEDSLIASLRAKDSLAEFDREPDCNVAVAKALGALAGAGEIPTATDLDHLPRSIGEYEIIRPLGRGGMGSVYLARHTKLGREVALKVLAGQRLADPRMRERFAAEMRAVGRLSHPNIVTAHDAREVDGTAVLVTEYIDGFDLGQLVSRTGPLQVADACQIIRKVAVALQYTSDQGFVHRDVKPSNIMLSATGEVKLLDLGLARLQLDDHDRVEITSTGQAMGTADYVAPEQVIDSRSVDGRADIYSLGCTLFKLLTGRAPFADPQYASALAKMNAHVSSQPPSVSDIVPTLPARLVKLVDSMLSKDPDNRPQTPKAVAEKLAAFTNGCELEKLAQRTATLKPQPATSLSSTSAVPRTKPWYGRPVPVAVAIAAGFCGALLGLLLGIVITITYPDGTKFRIPISSGSDVQFEHVPDVPTKQAAASTAAKTDNVADIDEKYAPLSFGVLIDEGEQYAAAIKAARLTLQASDGGDSVRTDAGTWHQIQDDIQATCTATHDGQLYALVSNDKPGRIRWSEIQGHVLSAQVGGRPANIQLRFDDELAKRMSEITGKNLNKQLAVIVDHRIVAAPFIRSQLGNAADISVSLTPEESRFLMQAINGGLVAPMNRETGASAETRLQGVEMKSRSRTLSNLKQIGIAFHFFQEAYKKLPGTSNQHEGSPGMAPGKQVQPFSWRVAILPFIQQQPLFEQYRFDEPWDSEANLKLLDKMPEVYRSPFAPDDQPPGHTNYQGFSREDSALGIGAGCSYADITDGTSNTLLIIESANSVPWTRPQDLTKVPSFFQDQAINMLMADGSVQSKQPMDESTLEKVVTRNGGEPVSW